MKPKYLLLAAFILISQSLHALPDSLNVAQWAKALSDKNDKENKAYGKLDSSLMKKDSSFTFSFLDALEKLGKPGDIYFQARFNSLKARQLIHFNFFKFDRLTGIIKIRNKQNQIENLIANARDKAYATEDDYLIAFISGENAKSIGWFDKGARIMYSLNNISLYEKLSLYIDPGKYSLLAGALYNAMEYDSCIKYMRKAVEGWQKSPPGNTRPISSINTIALCYQKEKKYDSATLYYTQALQYARRMNDTIWIGIISGNMGQIYYEFGNYDTARSLVALAYEYSLPGHYYAETANNLQWLARIDLALGNTQKALAEIRQAVPVLQLWDDNDPNHFLYLKNICYTQAMIFKEMKIYDSAFFYTNLYNNLNDSIQKEATTNSLSVSKARLDDLNGRYKIQSLNREKQVELTTRNMMIGGIALIALVALLLINRKRLKAKHEQEKAEQEKLLMQQQMVSAQEQLKMFTENIVEKSTIIEKLEQQQETTSYNDEQATIVKEIIHQSILTEEDWLQFKALFEKAHPGFFDKLREQLNDISLAETRMAALTRLKLTTKQMADVLGISTNSIVKAKQRLRQRFNVETNYEVETFISKL